MTDFGQGPFGPPPTYSAPPQVFAPPPQQPATPKAAGTVWSVVALIIGIIAVALTLVPFYTDAPYWVGLIAAAVALGGLAAGTIGLRQGRPRGTAGIPGVVASGVAIALAVVTVLVQVNHADVASSGAQAAPVTAETLDTATVLRDQLDVSFGKLEFQTSNGLVEKSRLPVTFHNKLNVTRDFRVVVAGFDDAHTQLADSSSGVAPGPIAANTTTTIDYFTVGLQLFPDLAERLKSADFRVILASSRAV